MNGCSVAAAAGSEKEAAAHTGARRADRDRVCHLWGFPLSRIGVGAATWCLGRGTQRRFAVSRIVRTCACLRMATSTPYTILRTQRLLRWSLRSSTSCRCSLLWTWQEYKQRLFDSGKVIEQCSSRSGRGECAAVLAALSWSCPQTVLARCEFALMAPSRCEWHWLLCTSGG